MKNNPNTYLNVLADLDKYIKNIEQGPINFEEVTLKLYRSFDTLVTSNALLNESNLKIAINEFSKFDHLFFSRVLRNVTTEFDHYCLVGAIGCFGEELARVFHEKYRLKQDYNSFSVKKTLFVIKGPFELAHMSFAKSFYYGFLHANSKPVSPAFAFLDDPNIPSEIQHCSHDLTKYSTFDKMLKLKSVISKNSYGTIIWPAVSQNMSLFLGGRFTKQQIYWSARHRNNFFKTIDKYFFGARFGAQNICYKATNWCYGRFFAPEWKGMKILNQDTRIDGTSDMTLVSLIKTLKASGKVIVGTISTDRKLKNPLFHETIIKYLTANPDTIYFFTSRDGDSQFAKILRENGLGKRFKQIKWIQLMTPVLCNFDLILDSFPVGASHALCYAVQVEVPFVSLQTKENISSSLLETLYPYAKECRVALSDLGFASNIYQYLELANKVTQTEQNVQREDLLRMQKSAISECTNNPIGMYSDFSLHILS